MRNLSNVVLQMDGITWTGSDDENNNIGKSKSYKGEADGNKYDCSHFEGKRLIEI